MQLSPGMMLVLIGLAVAAIGLLAMTGALDWFGRLPGDLRFERGGTRVYIPITSMIVVSLVLTVVVNVIARFLR